MSGFSGQVGEPFNRKDFVRQTSQDSCLKAKPGSDFEDFLGSTQFECLDHVRGERWLGVDLRVANRDRHITIGVPKRCLRYKVRPAHASECLQQSVVSNAGSLHRANQVVWTGLRSISPSSVHPFASGISSLPP